MTIDHIGFSTRHADIFRNEIGEMLSVSKDKVMLCFSHTHSAPNDSIETAYSDTGYFPTEEEYDKGGYEVYWSMLIYYIYHGRVSPLNRDSAAKLIEAAVNNASHSLKRNAK